MTRPLALAFCRRPALHPRPPIRRPQRTGVSILLRALALLAGLAAATVMRADEFDVLRQKWVDMLTGGDRYDVSDPATASTVAGVTSTANSTWSSMNKSATRTSLWSDAASTTVSADLNTNYSRLRAMALAYRTNGSSLKGNASLRDDIIGGLDWMYANRYNENVRIYDNWWHFEIGSPMSLTDTVALLYDQLTPTQIANYMRAVEKFTPSATTQAPGGSTGTFTGANRMWKIQVVALRGLIVKDAAKLAAARDAFSNLFLYVTSGDGFYVDGSFIQHGRHPYTGGYGASLISTIAPMLALLNGPNSLSADGSTWKVTDPNLANVYRWVHDSYQPVIYRGGIMSMTQGREVSRNSTSEHGTGQSIMQSILRISQFAPAPERDAMRALLRGWAEADTSRSFAGTAPLGIKPDVQQLMADPTVSPQPEPKGTVVLANMGRVVHRGTGFALGLSLSSTRTYTYESINGENLHAWYSGDGMTYLYNADLVHFSDAYWPTVNPKRLPGTTVDAGQSRTNGSGQSTAPSPTWAGGASLGTAGVAGMQLAGWSNSLRAKKSWFLFEDEIVCLGAAITSTDNRPIETTIENRLLGTNGTETFTVDGAARAATLGATETLTGAHWAHLAGRVTGADIGYYFPAPATLNATRETRTGAWSDINTGGPTTSISRNYLTLWIDHGANPTNASYAYALLPGRTAAQVAAYAAAPTFTVLENSTNAQAVRDESLGLTAANFWNDGSYTVGPLTSDHKASVVVRDAGGFIDLAVSDPTQANAGIIAVEYAAAGSTVLATDAGVTVTQVSPTIRLSVKVAGAQGRTFHATISTALKPAPRMTNLSTRAYVSGGDDAVIAGFVVSGPAAKKLVIRAAGPALTPLGVAEALTDPRITVVTAAGAVAAENDDWGKAANAADVARSFDAVGAFPFATGSRDAALLLSLDPGGYTVLVRSASAAGGIVLAEVYDADPAGASALVNVSSRVFCGTGARAAIVGFTLTGANAGQVLVRAAGPALRSFGVPSPVSDPQLRLVGTDGVVAGQNDDWSSAALAADIRRAAGAVGAFAFADPAKDAASLVLLRPGGYTAVVTDSAGGSGQTLIEAYAVPLP